MANVDQEQVILEHYRRQADEHGLEPTSTMADGITRDLEVRAILACVTEAVGPDGAGASLLEVGCGNGYMLALLRERFPAMRLAGADHSPDMVELASKRSLADCVVQEEDVRALSFESSTFDVVASERCLINVLDEDAQLQAVRELHRVLKPGGHLVFIEAFTDGAANLNRARVELGLDENKVPHHNRWFDKPAFLATIQGLFEEVPRSGAGDVPPRNFLSSHYFISRVLYPSVTRREVLYNTEFVKFFRLLPPQGDYSPIQLYFLRKPVG